MERESRGVSEVSVTSPLIHVGGAETNYGNRSDGGKSNRRVMIMQEAKKQLWLAGPLIAMNLLQYCLQLISLMFVGHQGKLALSGASMANSFASIAGFSLLMGMAGALDTLCGQSYGAKAYNMLGIHMQRAGYVLLILSIPLSIIWANAKSILIYLGQDQAISEEAGLYINFMIPSLFAYALVQVLTKFLNQQNIVYPTMLITGLTTLLHIPVCWALVFKSGLGNKGAALAYSISNWINVLLLTSYVKFSSSCAMSWQGFSTQALHNISIFLRLAIPSVIMVCLTIWSSETMVLLSGLLPNPVLETSLFSVCLSTATTLRMIPYGSFAVTSIRVSNELGAGHPEIAKFAINVALVMTLTTCGLMGLVLLILRDTWGYAYSNDVEVVHYVASMVPLLAVSTLLDGLQNVLSGTISGCGWQKIGAYVNLGSYILIGIPAALLLGFVLHLGVTGLWLAIICALVVQVTLVSAIIICTDWNQAAKKAIGRVYGSIIPESVVS